MRQTKCLFAILICILFTSCGGKNSKPFEVAEASIPNGTISTPSTNGDDVTPTSELAIPTCLIARNNSIDSPGKVPTVIFTATGNPTQLTVNGMTYASGSTVPMVQGADGKYHADGLVTGPGGSSQCSLQVEVPTCILTAVQASLSSIDVTLNLISPLNPVITSASLEGTDLVVPIPNPSLYKVTKSGMTAGAYTLNGVLTNGAGDKAFCSVSGAILPPLAPTCTIIRNNSLDAPGKPATVLMSVTGNATNIFLNGAPYVPNTNATMQLQGNLYTASGSVSGPDGSSTCSLVVEVPLCTLSIAQVSSSTGDVTVNLNSPMRPTISALLLDGASQTVPIPNPTSMVISKSGLVFGSTLIHAEVKNSAGDSAFCSAYAGQAPNISIFYDAGDAEGSPTGSKVTGLPSGFAFSDLGAATGTYSDFYFQAVESYALIENTLNITSSRCSQSVVTTKSTNQLYSMAPLSFTSTTPLSPTGVVGVYAMVFGGGSPRVRVTTSYGRTVSLRSSYVRGAGNQSPYIISNGQKLIMGFRARNDGSPVVDGFAGTLSLLTGETVTQWDATLDITNSAGSSSVIQKLTCN